MTSRRSLSSGLGLHRWTALVTVLALQIARANVTRTPTPVGHPEVSSQPDPQLCTRRSGTWRLACLASDPSLEPAPSSTDAPSTSVPGVTGVPFNPAHEPRPGVSRGLAHAYRVPDPDRRRCARARHIDGSAGVLELGGRDITAPGHQPHSLRPRAVRPPENGTTAASGIARPGSVSPGISGIRMNRRGRRCKT